MPLRPRHLSILAGLAVSSSRLCAQAQDTAYASRAVGRFLQTLRVDATLPDSLRHLTPGNLESLPTAYFQLLDDSSISAYLQTMASVLRQLPKAQCAEASSGGSGPGSLLAAVDSATVDALIIVYDRIIRAVAVATPRKVATRAEMQAAILRITGGLPVADQQRLQNIARNPPPSQDDACWFNRLLMDGLAKLPPEELGPVFRAMSAPPPARQE
jgi:hypothetical protein